MELLLIRHGLPLRTERADGSPADPPLAPEGRHQAERLAAWLARERLDALYTSPLRRALETAAPLVQARDLPLAVEPGLAEIDRAAPSYVPLEDLKAEDPEGWRAFVQDPYAGFDLEGFRTEVVRAVESIVSRHPGQRVAAVCHGGVINAWASHVLGIEMRLFFTPAYTSVSRFPAARDGARGIESLNETAHLRDEP